MMTEVSLPSATWLSVWAFRQSACAVAAMSSTAAAPSTAAALACLRKPNETRDAFIIPAAIDGISKFSRGKPARGSKPRAIESPNRRQSRRPAHERAVRSLRLPASVLAFRQAAEVVALREAFRRKPAGVGAVAAPVG